MSLRSTCLVRIARIVVSLAVGRYPRPLLLSRNSRRKSWSFPRSTARTAAPRRRQPTSCAAEWLGDFRRVNCGSCRAATWMRWLRLSGFDENPVLSEGELHELAKKFRADERITGRVNLASGKVHIDASLTLVRDLRLSQPLSADGATINEAAESIARDAVAARRQLIPLRLCENANREGKPSDAAARSDGWCRRLWIRRSRAHLSAQLAGQAERPAGQRHRRRPRDSRRCARQRRRARGSGAGARCHRLGDRGGADLDSVPCHRLEQRRSRRARRQRAVARGKCATGRADDRPWHDRASGQPPAAETALARAPRRKRLGGRRRRRRKVAGD